ITKTYATDPQRDAVLIDVRFEPKDPDLDLYVVYDPSLGNGGMGDSAFSTFAIDSIGEMRFRGLTSEDNSKTVASAREVSTSTEERTSGFVGISDGLGDLKKSGRIAVTYGEARNGNVVQMARITDPERFTLVLAFSGSISSAAATAAQTLLKNTAKTFSE